MGGKSLQPPRGINCGINRSQCARHIILRLSHEITKHMLITVKIPTAGLGGLSPFELLPTSPQAN